MELNQFISTLHQSKQQSITWHHQTTSFSEHKALQNYYEEILERIDGLVESIQGIYPRITSYTLSNPVDWTEGGSTIYFKGLYEFVETNRKTIPCQESWVQQQIDNISQLISETRYLLSLK
jgi:hypothetical protein